MGNISLLSTAGITYNQMDKFYAYKLHLDKITKFLKNQVNYRCCENFAIRMVEQVKHDYKVSRIKIIVTNELNMNKKSEYIIAKRNNSLAVHYKKWRNICDFN